VKQSLETANKRIKSQHQILRESRQRFNKVQQILQATKKQNKGKQTKAARKQIEQATGKVQRAKQKMKETTSKYADLINKAIELRHKLKEIKKRYPEYGLTNKQIDEHAHTCHKSWFSNRISAHQQLVLQL